jgi:predicted nucleic acid-binding protein
MDPRLRAIADRYILDVANVRFIAESVSDEAFNRRVVDSGWIVAEVLKHLASDTEQQARGVEKLNGGEPLRAARGSPDVDWPAADVAAIIQRLGRARDAIVAALASTSTVNDEDVVTLDRWSRHYARHGIDLAEAVPELRTEAMVLNWLLYADFRDDPVALRRQQTLLAEVRERYPHSAADEEGDKGDR